MTAVGGRIAEGVRSGANAVPRTVLGFFGLVLALITAGAASAVAVMAQKAPLHDLIPPVLWFAGGLYSIVVLTVCITMLLDPPRLMLGQITGQEFIESRKLTLGDSTAGDRLVEIKVPAVDVDASSPGPEEEEEE